MLIFAHDFLHSVYVYCTRIVWHVCIFIPWFDSDWWVLRILLKPSGFHCNHFSWFLRGLHSLASSSSSVFTVGAFLLVLLLAEAPLGKCTFSAAAWLLKRVQHCWISAQIARNELLWPGFFAICRVSSSQNRLKSSPSSPGLIANGYCATQLHFCSSKTSNTIPGCDWKKWYLDNQRHDP